ncbi:MAG: phosphoribosylformylglycinamidine cyclo-ligase [Candidatus Cloacimonetes bacterium]|nr:phosphoribosylformylglycinamidine cyclo-ligase [Candidatus Cloacimonadota bacterium]NLO11830.1 phosphoribosylformylglycinamidine cyclo-ligase [Candidatus Cloacimonadota bacterium]
MNYAQSGVDVEAGEKAVRNIKTLVSRSYNPNVLSQLGSFGGLFRLDLKQHPRPVLVSSTDGVGTKLMVAIMAQKYDTIGQDLVNHCVNDILVQGAEPLFFLDYIGINRMDGEMISGLIEGMTNACVANGCALIGGEMAEMPAIYQPGDFDLVGTIVGVVDETKVITGDKVSQRDILIGIPSSGLHTNGYSLARAIVFDKLGLTVDSYVSELEATVGELLLSVHLSYLPLFKPVLSHPGLHGLAHITGGGIAGNLKRIIPQGLSAYVTYPISEISPLFQWLQSGGGISDDEMRKAFNLGIGMIAVVDENSAQEMLNVTGGVMIGEIVDARDGDDLVRFID